MKLSKRLLFIFLFFTIVKSFTYSQSVQKLNLSARKFISPVYNDDHDIMDHDLVMKYINPDKLYLPDRVERAVIPENIIDGKGEFKKIIKSNKVANKIFYELFVDDGKWTFDKLLDRAKVNMTDADFKLFQASSAGIMAGVGRKFYKEVLKNNYILVYNYRDLHTQEEEYNRIDNANKERERKEAQNISIPEKRKYKYVPVKRTHKGYFVNLYLQLFKIEMDEKEITKFENEIYGLNGDNTDEVKINKLLDYNFKLESKYFKSNKISYTVEKEKARKNRYSKKYYLNKLFSNYLIKDYIDLIFTSTKDFRIKTTIFETKGGIQVKIGTKEGVNRNNRFFVYEMVQNRKGDIKKKRRGAIRAKKPVDDSKSTSGETQPTKFYQIQGRKLGKGMIVEERNNEGSLEICYGDGLYASLSGYLGYMTAGKFGLDYHVFYDHQLDSMSLLVHTFSAYIEKDIHFARNMFIGGDFGLFYQKANFVDPKLNEEFVNDEVFNVVLNWELGATAGIYIIPQLKLFFKVKYLPGKYVKESLFKEDGLFPVKRKITRTFYGLSFEF